MTDLRDYYLLDPEVVFLNHGSFGATPRPVLEACQEWQRRLERQPVQFLGEAVFAHLASARQSLGDYLHASPDELAFLPNVTHGVNLVARSLDLSPGDEILTSDHEYGACDNAWEYLCGLRGARYVRHPIPLPIPSPDELLDQFWQGVTARTRMITLSHITSPTASLFPIATICQRAREAGILTLVDGAHAPGQIPVDLTAIGADFYTGNCHKWLSAAKGSAFLYARRELQDRLQPLVVSWGWGTNSPFACGSRFLDLLQWTGTSDPAPYLSVPTAIEFQRDHDWPAVRVGCHKLLEQALARIADLTGLPPVYPPGQATYCQMAIAQLPPVTNLPAFKARLYAEHRVEVPLIEWGGRQWMRISVQGYNTQADIDALIRALQKIWLS